MYHIFYVNKGYMLVLDPPALGTVAELQRCIVDATGVEVIDQVLLLLGGETLVGNHVLANYGSAGTDTNPIFLVRRTSSTDREPVGSREQEGIYEIFQNWSSRVENLASQPVTAALGQQYAELGKFGMHAADTIIKFCAKVVSEHQHLNQGWMAVTSNLDDSVTRIQKRFERCRTQSGRLETMRTKGRDLLEGFDQTFDTLKKITVPCELLAGCSTEPESTVGGDMTLYEYMDSKDSYPLVSVVEHVRENMERMDDHDLRDADAALSSVKDLIKKPDYRDIRGIDKRLAMLDAKLRLLEDMHVQMKDSVSRIIQPAVAGTTQAVISDQRERAHRFTDNLNEFNKYAGVFITSKVELLKNITQRLGGWVKQGLRQRLDLVRQIKETPIMYATAVAEVVRRLALQKEFGTWIETHRDKCTSFISEENKQRNEFYAKLEKHFLRRIFHGLSDEFPNFCPEIVKFDQSMPSVTAEHLRDLRKTVSELHELLRVTKPDVYNRLLVPDPNAPTVSQLQSTTLRREESFFVREQTSNIDAMNRNFPSGTWLSGDENLEISPSSNLFFTKGAGFCSNSSLNIDSNLATPTELNPLTSFDVSKTHMEIGSLGSPGSFQAGSAPIAIPSGADASPGRSASEKSGPFRTPEEYEYRRETLVGPRVFSPKPVERHYPPPERGIPESQIRALQETLLGTLQQSKEHVLELAKHVVDVRQLVDEYKDSMAAEMSKCISEVLSTVEREKEEWERQKDVVIEERVGERSQERIMEAAEKFAEEEKSLKEILEHEKYLRKEKERELEEQKQLATKLNDDLLSVMKAKDDLHADVLNLETEKRKLEEQMQADASADYLSIELNSEEVDYIRAEIEKRKDVKPPTELQESTSSKETPSSSVEYEKAYKTKMQLLLKGIEERKNEELSKYREEVEQEIRIESERYIKRL
ncbi:CRE-ATG-11 protein, partial [Aphelenchoides avenae]